MKIGQGFQPLTSIKHRSTLTEITMSSQITEESIIFAGRDDLVS